MNNLLKIYPNFMIDSNVLSNTKIKWKNKKNFKNCWKLYNRIMMIFILNGHDSKINKKIQILQETKKLNVFLRSVT